MSEFTGKTIEEAIEAGLKELGITKQEADIDVLEEPIKKLFGGRKAKVSVTVKSTDGNRAVRFLDRLLEMMNVSATTELNEEDDKISINLITTNSASLIGYRGEVLDALQCLAGAVANIGREDYKRVVVDCEEYRAKREETLKSLAVKLADKAVKSGRKISLEPMNPFERRIIHATLTDRTDVQTHSEGKEPNRYIVIVPENLKYSHDNRSHRSHDKRSSSQEVKTLKKSSTTSWGGTFLGNSLKDN